MRASWYGEHQAFQSAGHASTSTPGDCCHRQAELCMDAAAQTPAASLPSAPMSHIPCILDLAAGNADVLQCAVVDRLLAARSGGSHARGAFSTTARRRWPL